MVAELKWIRKNKVIWVLVDKMECNLVSWFFFFFKSPKRLIQSRTVFPFFQFLACIVYVIFAVIFLSDARYHSSYGFPTYLYKLTFVEQSVVSFLLLLSTLFLASFLAVLGRVWWGRPFCYPYPYQERRLQQQRDGAQPKDFSGERLLDQCCACFH